MSQVDWRKKRGKAQTDCNHKKISKKQNKPNDLKAAYFSANKAHMNHKTGSNFGRRLQMFSQWQKADEGETEVTDCLPSSLIPQCSVINYPCPSLSPWQDAFFLLCAYPPKLALNGNRYTRTKKKKRDTTLEYFCNYCSPTDTICRAVFDLHVISQ